MTGLSSFQRGFSLVEAVIVIAITGFMVAAVALFLRWPFQSYLATERRGQMSDTADTALRRVARDLHIALPNSVRVVPGPPTCLETLPTRAGGRYRAAVDAGGNGDILDFTQADASFSMFGQFSALPNQAPVPGADLVAVYNLGPASPGADAYAGNNTALIAAVGPAAAPYNLTETKVTLAPAKLFPLASPSNRFQVISGPVSYVCTPGPLDAQGNGTGTLTRVSQYAITAAQACPPVGLTTAVLANNVVTCTITYTPAVQRNGVVQMQLQVAQGNEAVNIYHEVQVNNAP